MTKRFLFAARRPGSRSDGRRALLNMLALVLLAAIAAPPSRSQVEPTPALEQRVKAAFLYRFTEFITWPEAPAGTGDAFVIAIIGSGTMAEELGQIVSGRAIQGKPVQLRRLKEGDSLAGVQLIFIGHSAREHLPQIARAAPRGTLIVTEWERALKQGSIINFVLSGGRVRFEISLGAAERQGLRMSSRLLSVASSVETESP